MLMFFNPLIDFKLSLIQVFPNIFFHRRPYSVHLHNLRYLDVVNILMCRVIHNHLSIYRNHIDLI